MYFYGKKYKSGGGGVGGYEDKYSKYETDSFIKLATDVMFVQMSANADINKFGEKAVAAMVKEYRHIDKGPME